MIGFIGKPFITSSDSEPPVWSTRIATVFPAAGVIVMIPGIHASQRYAYVDEINKERVAAGQPALNNREQQQIGMESADLLVDGDDVLICPDPSRMDLAFAADEMLQQLLPRTRIKFLFAHEPQVREAINRRGEAWRIRPLPRSPEEMRRLIQTSLVAVRGEPIYYYGAVYGT